MPTEETKDAIENAADFPDSDIDIISDLLFVLSSESSVHMATKFADSEAQSWGANTLKGDSESMLVELCCGACFSQRDESYVSTVVLPMEVIRSMARETAWPRSNVVTGMIISDTSEAIKRARRDAFGLGMVTVQGGPA